MKGILAVGAGGFLGAVARHGVNLVVARFWTRDFPLATLLVNVSGSFILGFFVTWLGAKMNPETTWRLFVATGFVGAYTTFSTFELETERLIEAGAVTWGILNIATSVIAGYVAIRLGVALGR